MSLIGVLQEINQQNSAAGQPTDLVIGTVTSADPLEITINTAMAPLKAKVLYLTEPVVEKKIPVLQHLHSTPVGDTDNRLLESQIICMEHGKELPVEDGYIILNRALETGDKVLLLRVAGGQKFVVLSRLFEIGG